LESDREKPREPVLGPGALPMLGEMIVIAAICGLFILIAVLKDRAYGLFFGERPPAHHTEPLQPGESTVIDGVAIKLIN
jgi:hypothetical protein